MNGKWWSTPLKDEGNVDGFDILPQIINDWENAKIVFIKIYIFLVKSWMDGLLPWGNK